MCWSLLALQVLTDRSHLNAMPSRFDTTSDTLVNRYHSLLSLLSLFPLFKLLPFKFFHTGEGRGAMNTWTLNRIEEWKQMGRKTIETREGRKFNVFSKREYRFEELLRIKDRMKKLNKIWLDGY